MRAAGSPTTGLDGVGAKWRREVPPSRRLTAREQYLPWAVSQSPLALVAGSTTRLPPLAPLLLAGACSRAVNAGSCPTGPRHVTAARLPKSRTTLATLACQSTLQSHHQRQATPPRSGPTLSQPWHSNRCLSPNQLPPTPRSRASHSRDRCGATPRFRTADCRHHRQRGPAPSRNSERIPGPALRPTGLLRPFPPAAVSPATFLFRLVSSGVTTSSPAGSPTPAAAAAVAAGLAIAAIGGHPDHGPFMSSRIENAIL